MSICRSPKSIASLRAALQSRAAISPRHPSPRLLGIYRPEVAPRHLLGQVRGAHSQATKGKKSHVQLGLAEGPVTADPLWLRDHCQCHMCVHPQTKQRLLDTFSIDPKISTRGLLRGKNRRSGHGFRDIEFSDGHVGLIPEGLLESVARASRRDLGHGLYPLELWTDKIKENPPVVDYKTVMESDDGVGSWTAMIRKYGFAYVDGCPVTPEATQALIERIAFIRPTHYGGFWDFTSDLSHGDTAYTTLPLAAHTDTTYFSDPAGLQLFHLLSHTDGSGGESLLVDGFRAARRLRQLNEAAYKTLSEIKVFSHASGTEGVSIQPYRASPVFEHDRQGYLVQVRWNNSDRLEIDAPPERWREWYDAARIWNSLLKRPQFEYWEQLRPGRPLIFDNWRVLHGRSDFTGKRRLCGAYVNRDDFISRFRMTNRPLPIRHVLVR